MKRFILVLVVGLCIAAVAGAQNTPVNGKGAFGLQFSFAGFGAFGIGGVPSGVLPVDTTPAAPPYAITPMAGIGVKYFLSNKLALTGGLGVSSASATNTAGGVTSVLELTLQPGIDYYLVSSGAAAVYVGGFVSAGYASVSAKATPGATPDTFSGFGFGVGAILGAEYFILPKLSLGAEYNLALNYLSGSWTFGAGGTATASDFGFGTGSFGAYLTFYL